MDDVLLQAEQLKLCYPIYKGLARRLVGYVQAVDEVDLHVLRANAWPCGGIWL